MSRASGSKAPKKLGRALGLETGVFLSGVIFFVVVALMYGLWSGWEPVGSIGLGLLVGLWGMTCFYLWTLGRRIEPRPEDDPLAEVTADADYGVFSPWSWWPLVLGIAVALVFLGAAAGWWLAGIGGVVAVIGLVGQQLEFSRGQHAH